MDKSGCAKEFFHDVGAIVLGLLNHWLYKVGHLLSGSPSIAPVEDEVTFITPIIGSVINTVILEHSMVCIISGGVFRNQGAVRVFSSFCGESEAVVLGGVFLGNGLYGGVAFRVGCGCNDGWVVSPVGVLSVGPTVFVCGAPLAFDLGLGSGHSDEKGECDSFHLKCLFN